MSRWGPGTERPGARRVRLDQAQPLITREHGFHPQGSPGLGPVSGQCQGLSLSLLLTHQDHSETASCIPVLQRTLRGVGLEPHSKVVTE